MDSLAIKKLDPQATLPTRAHEGDAGLDMYSLEDIVLAPGQGTVAKTGVALVIPEGHVGIIHDRSSLGKAGIKTLGGVIDAGYRGDVGIIMRNLTNAEIKLKKGERIAQLIIYPIATPSPVEVEELDDSDRGAAGFGSTGK